MVKPISFRIAVVSVFTLGLMRMLRTPVLSIVSKATSPSFGVTFP